MGIRLREFARPTSRALRVGLTGGIGTGKSTVTRVLADLGARTVSADELARRVVEPGTAGLAAVIREFGADVLARDGSLDRRALAAVAFASPDSRLLLERITHPLIARAAADFFASLRPDDVGVYDVPLLAESGLEGSFDVVVVVEAPRELRLDRLEARGMSRADAEARMGAQASDGQRRAVAHLLIENSGTPDDLRRSAAWVAAELGLAGPSR